MGVGMQGGSGSVTYDGIGIHCSEFRTYVIYIYQLLKIQQWTQREGSLKALYKNVHALQLPFGWDNGWFDFNGRYCMEVGSVHNKTVSLILLYCM